MWLKKLWKFHIQVSKEKTNLFKSAWLLLELLNSDVNRSTDYASTQSVDKSYNNNNFIGLIQYPCLCSKRRIYTSLYAVGLKCIH